MPGGWAALARTNGINAPLMYAMAAVATHKREEVSVEELRAMQYTQRE